MGKILVAKGQATITTLEEGYHVSQSIGEYVFPASSSGTVVSAVTVVSTIKVTLGNVNFTGFTIGAISKPAGFSTITVNNTQKTITYTVAAGTTTLADHGSLIVPVLVGGMTYNLSFQWAKAKSGASGSKGKDGYTVKSSRQGCTLATDENGRIHTAVTVSTVLSALRGTTAVTPVIGVLPAVTGCSLSKSGTTVTMVFNTGTSLPEQGVIDLPVTVDGLAFTIPFSYAKARAGATGAPGTDANLLDWVNDWNTNKTLINNTTLVTPKIFAGVKNSDGTLTGTAIGRFILGVKNTSGSITNETVDGIYGFKDGYKTFFVDNGGNAQLGRSDQFIKYNAATGKVEFGAGVSLNWTNAISRAKTETIDTAALTAQNKADAAKNAAVSTAAADATQKVNAVKVGSRNYIRNSAFIETLAGVSADGPSVSVDATNLYNGYKTLKVIQNTACTDANANSQRVYFTAINSKICSPASFSMYVKGSVAGNLKIRVGGSGIQIKAITTNWQKVTLENIVPTSAVVLFGYSVAGTFWCALPMLVEGTKSSDWSPAPEDMESRIADAKKAGTDARTVADAITHKAAAEGWATKLTYIDANGIFTGTLSANVVNALHLNASQITSGTIAAARIDVNALKVALITAGNIEALTLNVTKGKMGGWTLDADSIFRGTKNNTSGAYTGASGSVTLGSNGLRGFKWRLDATGAGALAGGNISWDASGNVTFGSAVTLLWTTPINSITTALGGSGYPKLTKITAAGIYTGSITASQITAGTISADRIAVGSINATKLDAASIRSSIINTDYINGLSCTFVRGKIAGWVINASQIYKNNVYLGADGSITNGTKWKLNNDGSGQIAGGNILWNAAGTVSFSQAVSLNWKNDIEAAKSTNFGYRYYKRIVVNGESGKYYPVIIKGGDQTVKRDILVRRSYSEQAPSDWDQPSTTHMGGLILLIKANFGGWGGATYSWDIFELSECYSRMFGGAAHCGNMCMFAVFLRGGGTTGAVYHLYSDQPIENALYSPSPIPASPQIAYNSDLIFQSGETKAYAPAPRTLTTGVEDEIRRHRFIALAQSTDTTLAQHPLTYIGSTGIYTGTLTANQVNAVNISASSIQSGTLSADRIATGSIHASKLNAASIKSDIINTGYINGLTCTFVRGKIGGFTIGGDTMSVGTIGGAGATPLQIRSSSTGSGYWYTGNYKPLGITLTWHQSSNAGHIVFGQIAASGSTVKSGFIGIQMMSWDNVEYFCLSANYTRSGSKEIYNRIAGWAFDHTHIWKNNIALGSDGSITNSTKWKLNNDGSGQIANGNISWNASGSVTFASSVSVQWTTGITTAQELAAAMAFGRMLYRDPIFYNGNNSMAVYNNSGNGTVGITRLQDNNAPNDSKYVLKILTNGTASPGNGGFCFGTGCSYRKVLIARIIAKIPVGHNIQWASNSIGDGGSSRWLTSNTGTGDWKEYVYKVVCGTTNFSSTHYYYIDGTQGSSSAPLIWYVAYATVFDLTSSERYTTTIDSNGIYTASLNAGQITAGTISADRIAAGSITSAKLDAASIKANIINTSYINGLTCTFVRGSIGGWNINSSQIYKNSVALSSDGSITNGTKWRLNNDGSGYVANQNIRWDTSGNVTMTGTINANAGTIGGFTIAQGRIGATATGSGSGGGLAIYNDLFRVGNTTAYALLGANTFPATSGGTCATGRIVNGTYNSYLNNYGLYIDVRNGYRNYGVWSNASIVGTACIGNKIKNIYFTGSGYTIDFSQFNVFFVYANATYNINLPTSSSVASMFGYSSLPSDFACVITFIYNYNWGGHINIMSVRNENGGLSNYGMERGDTLTLLCSNYPSFHYQIISYRS